MDHKEEFEVVTAPDGSSCLSITLACATVREHYDRTTAAHSTVASDPAEVCSTGLRVYEGAQVLAAFIYRYGAGLVPPPPLHNLSSSLEEHSTSTAFAASPPASSASTARPAPVSVVELGCGCGLVGFTLDATLRSNCVTRAAEAAPTPVQAAPQRSQVSLVFTDASEDCLALVRRSGSFAGRSVQDWSDVSATSWSDSTIASPLRVASPNDVRLSTFRLAWSEAGVCDLQQRLASANGGQDEMSAAAAVQLVMGSDLMYYRVDVDALVHTAKLLLLPSSIAQTLHASPVVASPPGLIAFAHFMRIPDGQRKLATVARTHHQMAIVSVPLTAFLDSATVHFRGWNGIELVLLSPLAGSTADMCSETHEVEVADVKYMQQLLRSWAAEWETVSLTSSNTQAGTAARQARTLADALQPYPSSLLSTKAGRMAGEETGSAVVTEENDFLGLFL